MANKFSVLLADDDTEDQDILKEYLLRELPGLTIYSFLNGKDAVSWLDKCAEDDLPSLIILDYKMPIMNAVETLEYLENNSRYSSIEKVVWSTSIRNEYKNICIDRGASRYFSKPCNFSDLKKITSELLGYLVKDKVNIS